MQTGQRARSALLATTLLTTLLTSPLLFFATSMRPAVAMVRLRERPLEAGMTGGGVIRTVNEANGQEVQVAHGFELHCDASNGPNEIEVNWDNGENFHLERLGVSRCEDNATIAPDPPGATFDTLVASGYGRLANESGAFIFVIFTDAGEPGTHDTATIVIYDSSGTLVLNVTAYLDGGNNQAHGVFSFGPRHADLEGTDTLGGGAPHE